MKHITKVFLNEEGIKRKDNGGKNKGRNALKEGKKGRKNVALYKITVGLMHSKTCQI